MSRKNDLEGNIRECYNLIGQYEDIRRLSDDPKKKLHAASEITEQWSLIAEYWQAYRPLAGDSVPPDIVEITALLNGDAPRPSSSLLTFWLGYLKAVSVSFRHWYIPSEIQRLIDWPVEPVPLDDCIALRQLHDPVPLIGASTSRPRISVHNQRLLEVVCQREGSSVLLAGSSGSGKSTCLRYICSHNATELLLAAERSGDSNTEIALDIPVYVALRSYGPARLSELIVAQLHHHDLSITNKQLDDALGHLPFVFLFDGLDEVADNWRQQAIKEIEVFRQRYPQHRIIVTTRMQPQFPDLESFDKYGIEPLTDSGIVSFARHYLGDEDAFLHQIRERGLTDLTRVPLLLSLALVVFRQRAVAFDSLAEIYREIVHLYEIAWEEHKRAYRTTCPLPWDVLEGALSDLGYQMVSDRNRNSVSRQEALGIIADSIARFAGLFRWPSGHTADDLLNQLLTHNFLELLDDQISFWHASFRDYFAALVVIGLPTERIVELARGREWAPVTAFVGGLIEDSRSLRDALIQCALDDIDDSGWPIYTLSLMGSDTTSDIIRACSRPTNVGTLQLTERILESRGFEGVFLFRDTWLMLEYPPVDGLDWDPIIIENVSEMYESIMLALSVNALGQAIKMHKQLYRYFESFNPEPGEIMEPWLSSYRISDLDSFRDKLRVGQLSRAALLEFCRNTVSAFSLPYLEEIALTSGDRELRQEAHLAIQSIRCRENVSGQY